MSIGLFPIEVENCFGFTFNGSNLTPVANALFEPEN